MPVTTLDITRLSAPISLKSSVGIDLRKIAHESPLYLHIKKARLNARRLEAQQAPDMPLRMNPAWRLVRRLALQALAAHTKDLEITVWLLEALSRESGLTGLSDGFKLVREIIIRYWEEVYPLPDENGVSARLSLLLKLSEQPLEQIISPKFLQVSQRDLESCLAAFKALIEIIKEKAGDAALPVLQTLWQFEDRIKSFSKDNAKPANNRIFPFTAIKNVALFAAVPLFCAANDTKYIWPARVSRAPQKNPVRRLLCGGFFAALNILRKSFFLFKRSYCRATFN